MVKHAAKEFIKNHKQQFDAKGKNWEESSDLCDALSIEVEFYKPKQARTVLKNTGFHDFGDIEDKDQQALIAFEDDVTSEITSILDTNI